MKGNPKILVALNARLAEELTAISQYVVHAAMLERWGYSKLTKALQGHARSEMGHADALIDRILFLDGIPAPKLNELHIGQDVPALLANDHKAELAAVDAYNESVALATEVGDTGSEELFERHLRDEEGHVLYLEAQLTQIEQMGLANYLAGIV